MGQASWNLTKYERAIAEYERVVTNDGKHYVALKQRGKCYLAIGKYKEAINDFGVSRDVSIEELKRVYEHKELLHYLNRAVFISEEQQKEYDDDFEELTVAYKNLLARMENKPSSSPKDPFTKLYNLFDG